MTEGLGLSLSAFPVFDTQTDPISIGPRWRKWMLRFENRIKAMNLTDPERKLALRLLDYAGDDVHDGYLTLTVPPAAGGNNPPPGNDIYSRSVVALNNHYALQVQREYEIFSFRTAKQEENETLDQFVTQLRKLGATCDFANLSAEIKSQVIQRCKSSRLRTKGLSDLTMSLDDLIKTGNAMDRAVVYAQSMEGNTEMSVNQLATRKFTRPNHQRANRHDDFRRQQPSHSRNQPAETKCGHCGRSYPHEGGRESCPAFKQSCHNCGTVGHYAKLCRKPQTSSHGQNRGQGRGRSSNRGHGQPSRVHNQLHNLDVTEVDNHDDDYLYTVDTGKTKNSKPTVDDIISDLNGATTFSKLDLNQGYHQLELTPESRDATTFSTQDGLWRYKRLNFGVSSASEIFQHAIGRALSGIDGVKNMSDDIIVYGKTKAEHDRNLRKVFIRLRESHITLNRKKCEFNCTELKFYGFIFSDKGMTADPANVASIIQLEKPTNVSEMKSLLGMTNYSSRFVKSYSDKIQPLRLLTHQDTKWL